MLNNAEKYQTVPNNPEQSKSTMYPSMLKSIHDIARFCTHAGMQTRPDYCGALCDPGAAKEVGLGPWTITQHQKGIV